MLVAHELSPRHRSVVTTTVVDTIETMADVEEPVEDTPVEPEAEAEEEEEEFVNVGGATEVKLFGKWSFDDIEIRDISLEVRMDILGFAFDIWLQIAYVVFETCRITLRARETMPSTFHTRRDDTKRSDSARHLAPLWNDWSAVS